MNLLQNFTNKIKLMLIDSGYEWDKKKNVTICNSDGDITQLEGVVVVFAGVEIFCFYFRNFVYFVWRRGRTKGPREIYLLRKLLNLNRNLNSPLSCCSFMQKTDSFLISESINI